MGEVASFSVQPKQVVKQYRNHQIVVKYDPSTKKWRWTFHWSPDPIKYNDEADTEDKAIKDAMKRLDKCLGPT